jgi:hypothetical protein
MIIVAEDMKRLHTRVLLKALRMTRMRNSSEFQLLESIRVARGIPFRDLESITEEMMTDHARVVEAYLLGGIYGQTESAVTVEQLKAELATREHIPNKQESIALRKAKQQAGRNKGRRDR